MPRFKYNSSNYIKWRKSVYLRDRFTCQLCGTTGGVINAHHIKPKSKYPSLVYRKDNGITLCQKCHSIINRNEHLFAMLFKKIVNSKLDVDYVEKFFDRLAKKHMNIVNAFVLANKWKNIPIQMVNHIKKKTNARKRKKRTTI